MDMKLIYTCLIETKINWGLCNQSLFLKTYPGKLSYFLHDINILIELEAHLSLHHSPDVKSLRTTDDGHQVMAKAHIAFGKVSKI